jgi:hypothetical protein
MAIVANAAFAHVRASMASSSEWRSARPPTVRNSLGLKGENDMKTKSQQEDERLYVVAKYTEATVNPILRPKKRVVASILKLTHATMHCEFDLTLPDGQKITVQADGNEKSGWRTRIGVPEK